MVRKHNWKDTAKQFIKAAPGFAKKAAELHSITSKYWNSEGVRTKPKEKRRPKETPMASSSGPWTQGHTNRARHHKDSKLERKIYRIAKRVADSSNPDQTDAFVGVIRGVGVSGQPLWVEGPGSKAQNIVGQLYNRILYDLPTNVQGQTSSGLNTNTLKWILKSGFIRYNMVNTSTSAVKLEVYHCETRRDVDSTRLALISGIAAPAGLYAFSGQNGGTGLNAAGLFQQVINGLAELSAITPNVSTPVTVKAAGAIQMTPYHSHLFTIYNKVVKTTTYLIEAGGVLSFTVPWHKYSVDYEQFQGVSAAVVPAGHYYQLFKFVGEPDHVSGANQSAAPSVVSTAPVGVDITYEVSVNWNFSNPVTPSYNIDSLLSSIAGVSTNPTTDATDMQDVVGA